MPPATLRRVRRAVFLLLFAALALSSCGGGNDQEDVQSLLDKAFSNSIKSVAPALCPDVTYDDLKGIADGGAASTAYWSMASGRADAKTCSQLRQSLLAYCQRDTWALVRLHKALGTLARGKW